ncbi:hypothetical protein [Streptomyces violascens]|uniref:hypothetical protein n=1 Tax=Streptomyces violascens TaxID=67381 RepID=UPI0036558A79
MDLMLRIIFASGDTAIDCELARIWLAHQITFFTGLVVAGFEDVVHPSSSFQIAALEYIDAE